MNKDLLHSKVELFETGGEISYQGDANVAKFLLGGIGTGNIAVGARGQLLDWEIFNWPGKGQFVPFSFFAIRTKEEGEEPVSRILESKIKPLSLIHIFYYNKHMFGEAGLEYPQDGWTWDQFRETAEKLTKDGVYGFCFPCTYFQLTPWWSTNNAALVGEDGETPTVNSEGIVEAVDFLNGMYKDGICPEPISSDGYSMFANNQVAMVGAGRWVLNTWQDAGLTNDDFDCVQWPVKEKDGSVYGGSAWCIGSTTEHQDLAIELLKEMVSDETLTAVAAGGQQVPPTEALATSTDIMGTCPDNIMGIWKAVTIADPIAAPSYFGDLEQTFLRELEEVFSGAKEPQAAMDEAQAQIESAIQ